MERHILMAESSCVYRRHFSTALRGQWTVFGRTAQETATGSRRDAEALWGTTVPNPGHLDGSTLLALV